MTHAKELGLWHGRASPKKGGTTYYGPGAHAGTKYIALDAQFGGAISLCDLTGYHNARFVKAKVTILALAAAMTGEMTCNVSKLIRPRPDPA